MLPGRRSASLLYILFGPSIGSPNLAIKKRRMKSVRHIAALGVTLWLAFPTWAGPTSTLVTVATARLDAAADVFEGHTHWPVESGLMVGGLAADPLPGSGPGWPSGTTPTWLPPSGPTAPRDVLRLPAGPDSSALFLWALGGLGAWQLGRYTRKWQASVLPEWYHTGGPRQIGQSQRWDPQQPTLDVALWYEGFGSIPTPAGPEARLFERPAPCPAHDRPLAAAPRGPPWSS